jgi:DNA-binding transcriptional ArsR family regulator
LAEHSEQSPFEFLAMGSKQNLAHHFKVLREAGLIKSRYEGRTKVIWLRRDLIDDVFPGLLDGLLAAVAASQTGRV